jgi:hypothetical protein
MKLHFSSNDEVCILVCTLCSHRLLVLQCLSAPVPANAVASRVPAGACIALGVFVLLAHVCVHSTWVYGQCVCQLYLHLPVQGVNSPLLTRVVGTMLEKGHVQYRILGQPVMSSSWVQISAVAYHT